jgi:hypothetical protein
MRVAELDRAKKEREDKAAAAVAAATAVASTAAASSSAAAARIKEHHAAAAAAARPRSRSPPPNTWSARALLHRHVFTSCVTHACGRWVCPSIRVRVIDRSIAGGKHYEEKVAFGDVQLSRFIRVRLTSMGRRAPSWMLQGTGT